MSSLFINIHVTEAGANLKLDKHDFLKCQHHIPSLSPVRSTLPPHYNSHWGGRVPSYPSDGSIVSEGSVSSIQSDPAVGFYISLPLQDPIGTPRRPGANYPGGMHSNLAPLSQRVRERDIFNANVMDVPAAESNPKGYQQPKYGFVKASNMDNTHHRRMYTDDLVEDEDEYFPRRPAMPQSTFSPFPLHKEPTRLPRLYNHNPRFRDSADNAVRRMRTQALDGSSKPPTATQNPHPFRRHPLPIGDPNLFQPTRQSLRTGENPAGHIIRGIECVVEDDDEEIIVYLDSHLSAKKIAAAVAEEERMLQEVRPRKYRPAVLNPRAHGHILAERRRLSPTETRHHLDEESICQREAEVEQFHDFPVCEMSIAMGLHEPCGRSRASST